MDKVLENYRQNLEQECKNDVPYFDPLSSHLGKILALLQDPGKSGAEVSKTCSVWNNDDPTAEKQRFMLKKHKVKEEELLCWNFYGSFNVDIDHIKNSDKIFWAIQLEELIKLCPSIKVIIVFGKKAWDGMYYFNNTKKIPIITAPHPSRKGMTQPNAEVKLNFAWKSAKQIIDL